MIIMTIHLRVEKSFQIIINYEKNILMTHEDAFIHPNEQNEVINKKKMPLVILSS